MKSGVRFVLKAVAIALATAAAVCTIIAFWDKISGGVLTLGEKVRSRRRSGDEFLMEADEEEYADWDE